MLALKVHDKDNVATVFAEGIHCGSELDVRDKKGNLQRLKTLNAIPYGHKLAIKEIPKGEMIVKYGEIIGIATKEIRTGDYVHVHNLDSLRGRGDL